MNRKDCWQINGNNNPTKLKVIYDVTVKDTAKWSKVKIKYSYIYRIFSIYLP